MTLRVGGHLRRKTVAAVVPRHTITLFCVLSLVAVACAAEPTRSPTTTNSTLPTTTTTTLPPDPAVDGPVYRIGLISGITTVNWWEATGTATPEDQAVVANTKESLFALTPPDFVLEPALAATPQPRSATQEGSAWVVEQPIRDDVIWSDGEPVTAEDLVFYFDVVREFGLDGGHAAYFPDNVTAVSAIDDFTVRIEFGEEPSLTDWETGAAMAPLVPAHFWEPHVDAARRAAATPEPRRQHLYSVDPSGEPSSGSLVFESWDGDLAVAQFNPDYYARGPVTMSDRIPSRVEWHGFDSEEEAHAALVAGRVDFVHEPDGMSFPEYNELAAEADTGIAISEADGFRFLAFNLRKPPMSDPVFRNAVATIIDKELIASSLYNGTLFPAYTVVHPGLPTFHNTEVNRPGWSNGEPMTEPERYQTAIVMLSEAGYTWDVEPEIVYDETGRFVDVVAGSGLEMPNGVDVPELTILTAPEPGEDPMRATVALWIERWMTDLGMMVETEPTDLSSISSAVVQPASFEDTLSWDLHVLGWGRSNPALPGLTLAALFHSLSGVETGGLNTTGYSSAAFDAAADSFVAARTMAEAARWTKEMEAIIGEDLPYVVLYREAVIEAFGSRVELPTDSIVGGHAVAANGWPASVRIRG